VCRNFPVVGRVGQGKGWGRDRNVGPGRRENALKKGNKTTVRKREDGVAMFIKISNYLM
jgi:hypothetical protein